MSLGLSLFLSRSRVHEVITYYFISRTSSRQVSGPSVFCPKESRSQIVIHNVLSIKEAGT